MYLQAPPYVDGLSRRLVLLHDLDADHAIQPSDQLPWTDSSLQLIGDYPSDLEERSW